jgi:hypothetical protein
MAFKPRPWTFLLGADPHIGQDVPLYVHQRPLPSPRCFRVFHLQPQPEEKQGELEGVLQGRIAVEEVDNIGSYDALSYCWAGSLKPSASWWQRPQTKDRILVHMPDQTTRQLVIEPALSTALRYIRARGQPMPLFVDQISIDQSDNDEKNHQVALMGDIYRNCARVVAWLDVATEHTDSFFDFIPHISDSPSLAAMVMERDRFTAVLAAIIGQPTDTDFVADQVGLQRDVELVKALVQQHQHRFPYRGFVEICLRQWFRRVWIVQEACLGREMVLVCGRRSCSAQDLDMVANFLLLSSKPPTDPPAVEPWSIIRTLRILLFEIWRSPDGAPTAYDAMMAEPIPRRLLQERRKMWSSPGQQQRRELSSIVNSVNVDIANCGPWVRLGATNPRDHIYALRGLASEDDRVARALMPDYAKPSREVFTDFTALAVDPSIDILLLSQLESKQNDPRNDLKDADAKFPDEFRPAELPSWVPDWSGPLALPHGYQLLCMPMFWAGSATESEVHSLAKVDCSRYGTLRANGVLLGEVERVGKRTMDIPPPRSRESENLNPQTSSPLPRTVFDFFREVRELCEWAAGQPAAASIPSPAKLDEAVWITTTGGHGLSLTAEKSLLGAVQEDGRPLLGRLWELQLAMDVFPTIMKRRRDGLSRLAGAHAVAMGRRGTGDRRPSLFAHLRALFAYWTGRLTVELVNIFWCYRFFIIWPFTRAASMDMLYYAVLGETLDPHLSLLQAGLPRHVGRKCFASGAGHVGLGPRGTKSGDVVVVFLGATTPVILRPGPTAAAPFEYVGEAYCHGFMHGEAVRGLKEEDIRWFEIE